MNKSTRRRWVRFEIFDRLVWSSKNYFLTSLGFCPVTFFPHPSPHHKSEILCLKFFLSVMLSNAEGLEAWELFPGDPACPLFELLAACVGLSAGDEDFIVPLHQWPGLWLEHINQLIVVLAGNFPDMVREMTVRHTETLNNILCMRLCVCVCVIKKFFINCDRCAYLW